MFSAARFALAVLVLGSAYPAPAADAPAKVHALLVCDTTDENLRSAAGKDRDHMRGILKNNIPDKQLSITVIEGSGAKIKPAGVMDYYKNLTVGPADALLFYYTGHGSIRQGATGDAAYTFELQSDGHPGKAPLARGDVRKAMEAKNPRLVVILSDCCSNRLDLPAPKQALTFALAAPAGPPQKTSPLMQSLFFNTTGVVSITAATKDVAVCDAEIGGYFTYSLFNTVTDTNEKSLSWTGFYDRLKQATPNTHKWAIKKGNTEAPDPGHKLQTPEALSLGQPKRVGGDAEPVEAGKLYAVVSLTNTSNKAVKVQLKWPQMERWATIELKPGDKQHATQVVATDAAYDMKIKVNGQEQSLKSKIVKSAMKPGYADGVEHDLGKIE